jgi:hypothetical protein
MFYEEKFIDGRWYWRGLPNSDWLPFTPEHYVQKLKSLEEKLIRARLEGHPELRRGA